MSTELAKQYRPADVEPDILKRWNETNAFHADASDAGEPFAIVIPPPNVTAALHMGHALNNTLQDILVRWHRMLGDNTMWMPGTDHAGIATQTIVDKRLQASGEPALKDYKALEAQGKGGREQFLAKVQAWKDEYEATILGQLKTMGSSCDWDRTRFTMDPVCAAAVREAFFQLFKDGLIYRGKRLVNWDPVSQTALADDEVEMEEIDGQFYYLRYPLIGPPLATGENYITVATTRPETMLGDTAVAINPKDPRAAQLRGRLVLLPIVNREIPIVEDDYVVLPLAPSPSVGEGRGEGEKPAGDVDPKAKFATGFLKVTPAHDPNDYDIGLRHQLPIINVFAPDASISKDHGWPAEEWDKEQHPTNDAAFLLGMDRFKARKEIVRWFKEHQMLEDMKPYKHSVGHSYRSHVPIEPYLSDQWYVKVTDDRLAGAALRAIAHDQFDHKAGTAGPGLPPSSSSNATNQNAERPGPAVPALWQGQLRFHPARYAKTFQQWHENIRDWCISRQLWWGHRIPVWRFDTQIKDGYIKDELQAGLAESLIGPPNSCVIFTPTAEWRNVLPDKNATNAWSTYRTGPLSIFVALRTADAKTIQELERLGFTQDPDVLDTWFSSGLWPISTLGWPNPAAFPKDFPDGDAALKKWNPSNVLCTAREIITLWVSRMTMFNIYFRNCLPFNDVFVHAMIQDGEGQKMSKTLGNGVDPLDIIHSHGSDAMRYTLAAMTTQTQDVRMPVSPVCPHCGKTLTPAMITISGGYRVTAPVAECPACKKSSVSSYGVNSGEKPTAEKPAARNTSEKFDLGRNFANKLWNATRFALANLEGKPHHAHSELREQAGLPDKWILSRLAAAVRDADEALAKFDFSNYAQGLYDFIWRDLCDWYIEAIKPVVQQDSPAGAVSRKVLALCIDASLRLLHPVMPFITEKLWERLNEVAPHREISGVSLVPSELLIHATWPMVAPELIDPAAEAEFGLVQQVVSAVRQVRTTYKVPPKQNVTISAKAPAPIATRLLPQRELIQTLANVTCGEIGPRVDKPADAAAIVVADTEHYIHGLVEGDAEKGRLTKRLAELEKNIAALSGRLSSASYTDKAPAKLVQQTRDQLAAAEREKQTIEQQLAVLG